MASVTVNPFFSYPAMPFHAPAGDWGLGWQNRQANPAAFPVPGAGVPGAVPAAAGFLIS